jgi:Uma2 family endonuclease
MAIAPHFIPLDEYMRTAYSPDCDYVDGAIVERNVGKGKHAYIQLSLGIALREQTRSGKLVVTVEHRIRVSATRVRIPDVCVVAELEEVITKPPLLCVEVLSPDDRWERVNATVRDYQTMGVACVWVIDPYQERAWIFAGGGPPFEALDGLLAAALIGVEVRLIDLLPTAD